MSFLQRRRVWLVVVFALLALFVLRPGVNGLRKRIVNSVSLALGRRVDVQWVKLRVLPQPGFDLVNFVVHDDPAYSAEPVLRAEEVTAVLRLRSLLRGRIEIGRLSLKEPSFNLVRGDNGHWNIESLSERAAHTEAAPTRNTLPESRPVFPYIEADNGRINFKIGLEKKSYSLTDADFALWLESDDQWGMRMAAQPVRTDLNLTDTGTLRVNGTWQRSGSLRDTPLKFTLRWDGGQMGELTKLLYGTDMGWRGGLVLSADLSGTPADLKVEVQSAIDGFRRYDIVTQQSLRLATACEARYSSIEHAVSDLSCRSPIGQGRLSVKGRIGAPTGPRTYDLSFGAEDVPIQALVNLARRAKKDLPEDLSATGTVAGTLSVQSSPTADRALRWEGSGRTEHFVLRSASANTEVTLGTIPFSVQSALALADEEGDARLQATSNVRLAVGPLTMPLAKQSSTLVQGWATASGYSLSVQGEGPVQRLLQTAQMAGLPVPQLAADGLAKFNLLVSGKWMGFAAPRPTGTAQLRSVRAQLPGLAGAVDIHSADLSLDNDTIHANKVVASAAGANWEGSVSFPRPCHLLSGCPIHFELHADVIAAYRLHQWLSPGNRRRAWYRFGGAGTHTPSLLNALNASGSITANRVEIRGVAANRVACNLDLHKGVLHLAGLTADVLGGKHRGNWAGNLTVSPPEFTGTGKFEHVALAQLADAMHDGWVAGTAMGSYQFAATGGTVQDWVASAKGTLQFEMRDGSLPHIVIPPASAGPLRVRRFSGRLAFRDGTYALEAGKLESGGGSYEVTGSSMPGQKLQMKLASSSGGYLIDGTLSVPHVVPVSAPDTRAALKP